jgi:tetratricopeptide (TPR) repeat protein
VLAILLPATLVLTGWNVTRSDALDAARRSYARGDLASSLGNALDHLTRQPWSHEAALLAGRCLSRLDYAEAAEPYYRRAGNLTLADLHIRAYGLVRGNHRERAIQAYHEILARWPENVMALRRLAAVEMTQSNDLEVQKLSERLVRIPSAAAIGYTLRGVVEHNDNNPEQAVAAFERVLELDPELREMPLPRGLFWSHLTSDLLASGRPAEARRYLARAMETDPDPRLLVTLGRAYDLEGETAQAERCFRQAVEQDPNSYAAYLYLGKIELHSRRADEALDHLKRALELAPRSYDALSTLALAYRQLGREAEARRFQEKAEAIHGKPSPPPAGRPEKSPWPRYAL